MTGGGDRWSPAFEADGWRARVGRALFGDRVGLVVFLASVSLFAVYWVADWRINDSLTLYNALYAMADGHLHMTEPAYGGTLRTPGSSVVDGAVYGRNYGVLVVSLLPLALFRALGAVADLRIAVAGLWVLGLLAATLLVGRVIGRRRAASRWGSVAALGLFALSVAVSTELDPARGELYALQFTHLIAAGFAVVLLYRLLARAHGRQVGLFGAVLAGLGTPLGLWATVPKRHVLTAAAVFAVAYALYRSREAGVAGTRGEVSYRAGAYAVVGLLAWVHAPEALALFVVLAAVDVPTGTRTDVRAVAGVAGAFLLSLVPFFVTNAIAFGAPATPPRMLDGFGGDPASGTGAPPPDGAIPVLSQVADAVDPAMAPLLQLVSLFETGLATVARDPGRLWDVFVRSGYPASDFAAAQANHEAVNLAMLESGPAVAAVVGVVAGVGVLRRGSVSVPPWRPTPRRLVDAFVGLFAVAFTLLYLSRLPIHAQITMRYLVPVFPALVYGLVRLRTVRTVATDHWRPFAWTVAAGVLVGGQLVVVALATLDLGRGEAFQLHALAGLGTAAPLGAWALVGRSEDRWGQVGAVLLGLATAATTVFLLLLTVEYWLVPTGPGLPIVDALGDVVSFL